MWQGRGEMIGKTGTAVGLAPALIQSMIRKSMSLGYDPMGGNRFSLS
jgi:hypothetical protein